MAAPPVKSQQPLHNFSLPRLKWGAHRNPSSSSSAAFRRRDSPDPHHHRRHRDPDSAEPRPTDHKQPPPPEEENGDAKPWRLRPRKEAVAKPAAAPPSVKKEETDGNGAKSQRLRGMAEGGQTNGGGGGGGGAAERKTAKRRLWISLSREEIEEDIYALTGGRPARRPKKWPKNVQKQLDNVFPGLYLVGVAADSYRVMML